MVTVFTVGYGGRKFDRFVELLKRHGIDLVVDVRRFPKSKDEHYLRENLERELPKHGISYVYLGDLLGGFRRGGYEKYMESEDYMRGISRLLELAEEHKVVIMCVERNVRGCHRRYISRTLEEAGVEVIHL